LFDANEEIILKGTSHHPKNGHTVHAEQHALGQLHPNPDFRPYYGYLNILIVTLGKSRKLSYSSCPCIKCASSSFKFGIEYIYYPEKVRNNQWRLCVETPISLLKRVEYQPLRIKYARDMRIPK
jgi:deoxycytidylate deaminase